MKINDGENDTRFSPSFDKTIYPTTAPLLADDTAFAYRAI